jgi:hypothetical protein
MNRALSLFALIVAAVLGLGMGEGEAQQGKRVALFGDYQNLFYEDFRTEITGSPSAAFTSNVSFSRVACSPAGNCASAFNSAGQLSFYGANVARFDHLNGASLGLLLEAAATNIQLYSTFTSGWSESNLTLTPGAATSPDGTVDAATLNDGSATNIHQAYYELTTISGDTYAGSVYEQAGTGRYLSESAYGGSDTKGAYATSDLSAGVVTQSGALSSGGTLVAANVQYVIISTANAGTYSPDSAGRDSYTGTSATWNVYCAQLEIGLFSTSCIPTTSSSVTRAADVASIAGALETLAVTNPIIVERQSEATGVVSRTLYAANTFSFVDGYWYRQLVVCPAAESTALLNRIAVQIGDLHC